jgi:large subunit ribosomal protein L35
MTKIKHKTRKSISRRFKFTKNGKILRRSAFRRHLKASKNQKRLKNLKKMKVVTGYQASHLRRALGIKKPKKSFLKVERKPSKKVAKKGTK